MKHNVFYKKHSKWAQYVFNNPTVEMFFLLIQIHVFTQQYLYIYKCIYFSYMLNVFKRMEDNFQKRLCFSKKREDNVQKKHKNVSYSTKNNSKDVCFLSKHFERKRHLCFDEKSCSVAQLKKMEDNVYAFLKREMCVFII